MPSCILILSFKYLYHFVLLISPFFLFSNTFIFSLSHIFISFSLIFFNPAHGKRARNAQGGSTCAESYEAFCTFSFSIRLVFSGYWSSDRTAAERRNCVLAEGEIIRHVHTRRNITSAHCSTEGGSLFYFFCYFVFVYCSSIIYHLFFNLRNFSDSTKLSFSSSHTSSLQRTVTNSRPPLLLYPKDPEQSNITVVPPGSTTSSVVDQLLQRSSDSGRVSPPSSPSSVSPPSSPDPARSQLRAAGSVYGTESFTEHKRGSSAHSTHSARSHAYAGGDISHAPRVNKGGRPKGSGRGARAARENASGNRAAPGAATVSASSSHTSSSSSTSITKIQKTSYMSHPPPT